MPHLIAFVIFVVIICLASIFLDAHAKHRRIKMEAKAELRAEKEQQQRDAAKAAAQEQQRILDENRRKAEQLRQKRLAAEAEAAEKQRLIDENRRMAEELRQLREAAAPVTIPPAEESQHQAPPQAAQEEAETVIHVPPRIDGAPLAYQYDDVHVTPCADDVFAADWVDPHATITMQPAPDRGRRSVLLLMDGHPFAYLEGGKLAEMAFDWAQRNDPYFVALRTFSPEEKKIVVFLGFYRQRMLRSAKEYRLISNRNVEMQSNIALCSEDDECTLDFDTDKEKYLVYCGFPIGYLPASATAIVDEVGEDDVTVTIASIETNDTDQYVVTVCIEY